MAEVSPQIKALATIGGVCLQYSLLELTLANVIAAMLDLDDEKTAIVTGGADMKARLGMAIALSDHMRAPYAIRQGLKNIRTKLKEKDLIQRRNQAVHGAQRTTGLTTTFKMLRWKGARREEEVSILSLHEVATELNRLSEDAHAVFLAIGKWRFGEHPDENAADNLSSRRAVPRLKLTQRLYARVEHFWRNR
jgi:hypothetical protein